jgi:hypothetical protein
VEVDGLVVVADLQLEAVADAGDGGGAREADAAVLGGERYVDDTVEAARCGWAGGGVDRLTAGVDDEAIRRRAADDLGEEGQGGLDGDTQLAVEASPRVPPPGWTSVTPGRRPVVR